MLGKNGKKVCSCNTKRYVQIHRYRNVNDFINNCMLTYVINSIYTRTCHTGAGQEQTPGKADTPGFKLRDKPAVVNDNRGYLKLELR